MRTLSSGNRHVPAKKGLVNIDEFAIRVLPKRELGGILLEIQGYTW